MDRLAVLADIHGNLPALEAVLGDLARRGTPDGIWVLGDLVALYPWVAETLACLRSLPGVHCLQGNTDRYLVTGQRHPIPVATYDQWKRFPQALTIRDECFQWMVGQLGFEEFMFLRDLPDHLALQVNGFGSVLGVHAAPGDDERRLEPETPDDVLRANLGGQPPDLLLFGHTHTPILRRLDATRLANPGSVGFFTGNRANAAYALVTFCGRRCEVELVKVAYDVAPVLNKLADSDYPGAPDLGRKLRAQLAQ